MNDKTRLEQSIKAIQKMREATADAALALHKFSDFHAELFRRISTVNATLDGYFPNGSIPANELLKRVQEFSASIAGFASLSDVKIDKESPYFDDKSALQSIVFYLQKEVERMESKGMEMNEAYFGQEFGNEGMVISGNVAKFILQKLSQ